MPSSLAFLKAGVNFSLRFMGRILALCQRALSENLKKQFAIAIFLKRDQYD